MNTLARFPRWPDSDDFRRDLRQEFDSFLIAEAQRFDPRDRLRIDLHCHDRNSDVPDELWGRILGLPETWLKTTELVRCLRGHGSDVITVTNHNNARSCWDLLERGEDVLVGAEFTCFFPEMDLYSSVCAVQNLWLAARAEGLGVGWVSIIDHAALAGILGLPPSVQPVAYLCIGSVAFFHQRPELEEAGWLERSDLKTLIHHDRWGQRD